MPTQSRSWRFSFTMAAFCVATSALSGALAQTPEPSGRELIVKAIQPFVDRNELAGAITVVATRDQILSLTLVGSADIAAKKPMQRDTMFWIASQSKPITAVALMILVDEGKVQLDDPVSKYLPEFKAQMVVSEKDAQHVLLHRAAKPITIRHLLSHTSGMPFKSALEEPTLDLYPLSARVKSYAMTPLDSQPGTKYQYSNAGINTAARVVEVVSGIPFEKFLEERLFRPLGMNDTTFWPSSEQVARLARAYKPGPGNKGLVETPIAQLHYPLTDRMVRTPMPAGGLFSTASDLVLFYQMLLNGGELKGKRYLKASSVQELTRKQTPPALPDGYGLGFAVGPHNFGHGGAYGTNSSADSESGVILIWLIQHEGFPGDGKNAQSRFREAALESVKQGR